MRIADQITLYATPTPNSHRVAIALEELRLRYELRMVARDRNEHRVPAYLAINPAAMMPTLVADDRVISQSGAILIYLAEMQGRLLPTAGTKRYAVLQWLMHVLTDVQGHGTALHLVRTGTTDAHPPSQQVLEDRLSALIGHCDAALSTSTWLAGGDYSIADIALYPVIAFRRPLIEKLGYRHVARWADELQERDAVRKGMAIGQ